MLLTLVIFNLTFSCSRI
uniref:Uncharacterized protein n=1 Tax=Arundo donax TaxID=35708 RepID=A0A0A9GRF1_ARUDO